MWFLIVLLIILVAFLFLSIKIVREAEVYIIERLGKFHKAASAGLTIIIPFVDHVRSIVSLKQQTLDIDPQDVITKDNVTITINTVVFYKIIDPVKAVYEIQNLKRGIEYLSVTATRDLVGKMDLDSTFSSRDIINDKLRALLDEATSKWGCSIYRVEVQDINPPADIRDAMEKQMNAERNKRAVILQAEGERQAAVLKAQGEKEAAILKADADREAKIRKAVGEADAIKRVAEAKAEEIKMIYNAMMKANPDQTLVQLKSLETLKDVANGDANKVFIPFEATATLASIASIADIAKDGKKRKRRTKLEMAQDAHEVSQEIQEDSEITDSSLVPNVADMDIEQLV